VEGTRYFVEGTRYFVEGTRYFVDGTRYFVEGTRYFVEGTRYFVECTRYFVEGTRYRFSLFFHWVRKKMKIISRYQVSNLRFETEPSSFAAMLVWSLFGHLKIIAKPKEKR
jgi:hypothetical protein